MDVAEHVLYRPEYFLAFKVTRTKEDRLNLHVILGNLTSLSIQLPSRFLKLDNCISLDNCGQTLIIEERSFSATDILKLKENATGAF